MEGRIMDAAGKSVGASLGCKLPAAGADGGSGAGDWSGAEFDDGDCRYWSLWERARGSGSTRTSGVRG